MTTQNTSPTYTEDELGDLLIAGRMKPVHIPVTGPGLPDAVAMFVYVDGKRYPDGDCVSLADIDGSGMSYGDAREYASALVACMRDQDPVAAGHTKYTMSEAPA